MVGATSTSSHHEHSRAFHEEIAVGGYHTYPPLCAPRHPGLMYLYLAAKRTLSSQICRHQPFHRMPWTQLILRHGLRHTCREACCLAVVGSHRPEVQSESRQVLAHSCHLYHEAEWLRLTKAQTRVQAYCSTRSSLPGQNSLTDQMEGTQFEVQCRSPG